MRRRLRLVLLGIMGRAPWAGQTWAYLNWLRAFHRLGHEVWYAEDDSTWPYDPEQETVTDDCRYAVRHVATCLARIGLPDRWAFRLVGREGACWGLEPRRLDELYRTCDALFNVEWSTHLREEHLAAPLRVLIESDPVAPELRYANGDASVRAAVEQHHVIVTRGENYGAPDCGVPLGGLEAKYRTTRQPVDLDLWPAAFDPAATAITTIGHYRQAGCVTYRGEPYYYSKHPEWEKVLELPRRTGRRFEVALAVDDPADRARLEAHGWRLVPPLPMSLDVFGAYPA
ncbi:MAG TPA: hypothetical protein VNM66_07470, partial [Thermodesulfobacteriota bacterium]|nr:hypothetical protein [Thermodesulfobacteriota bacterium]